MPAMWRFGNASTGARRQRLLLHLSNPRRRQAHAARATAGLGPFWSHTGWAHGIGRLPDRLVDCRPTLLLVDFDRFVRRIDVDHGSHVYVGAVCRGADAGCHFTGPSVATIHRPDLAESTSLSTLAAGRPEFMTTQVATAQPESLERSQPQPKISLWQRFSFGCMRSMLALLMRCFGLSGLYRIGRAFGTLECSINYKRRRRLNRLLRDRLGQHLDDKARRRAVRGFFARTRCDKIFYLIFDLIPRQQVIDRFHITNRQIMDQALARGNGCFVAMAHHGSHHVVGMLMALAGYSPAAVRDPKEGAMRQFVQNLYDRRYPEFRRLRIISADAFPREIFRCFQENRPLGAALDAYRQRDDRKRSVTVDLFGQQRDLMVGTLQIALRCGAGIIQGFVISEPNFHYRLDFLGPLLDPSQAVESPELIQSAMDRYATNLERYILQYPDHISRV